MSNKRGDPFDSSSSRAVCERVDLPLDMDPFITLLEDIRDLKNV